MKIAFAFTWLFNPNVGGTERVTDILTRELSKRGHTIYYIYSVKRDTDQSFDNPAEETFYIPEDVLLSDNGVQIFQKYIRAKGIDVVINQGGVMGTCRNFVNVPAGCKSVTTIHFDPRYGLDSLFMEQMRLRNRLALEKLKRIYRFFAFPIRRRQLKRYLNDLYTYWGTHCEKVVLLSDKFIPAFRSIAPGFPDEKLSAIPNPISFPVNKDCSEKRDIILWVGRMDFRQKRPDLMVEIWGKAHKMIPGWELIMLGEGPALDSVKDKAKGLPRIKFPGAKNSLPYYRISKILSSSSSSSSSSEGWGMVLTEAASQGTVPIAFDSYASVRDIIGTEAQLVAPYDTLEYAKKIHCLATNETLLLDIREKGYETANRYSIESVVNRWEELLREII